jgi:hypothetical protein
LIPGGVIDVKIFWDCNLDWDFLTHCKPAYTFTRLDNRTVIRIMGVIMMHMRISMTNMMRMMEIMMTMMVIMVIMLVMMSKMTEISSCIFNFPVQNCNWFKFSPRPLFRPEQENHDEGEQ